MDTKAAAIAKVRSLAPGVYFNRLDKGKVLVLEVFRGWKDDTGETVSGWYKNIFNCEEDAYNHLVTRGVKRREPSPQPHSQEVEEEHSGRSLLEPNL